MTPYEEFLALGTLGMVGYRWWKKQVRGVANRNGFPPPGGHASWTDDASADWLAEAFQHRGKEFIAKIVALASDDDSYGKVARKSIMNEFIDGAKATTVGKLRGRMRTILATEPGFADATNLYAGKHAWTIASLGDVVWAGNWKDLLRLPGYSRETIAHLNTAGRTSADNRRKLVDATRVLLEGAGGAVPDQAIASVLVELFELEDIAPYLLGDEDVAAQDSAFSAVDSIVDRENGWQDPREYESAVGWLDLVAQAEALLAELTEDDKKELSLLDEESLETAGPAFRRATTRLGTSHEAMLIAISRCAEYSFDE